MSNVSEYKKIFQKLNDLRNGIVHGNPTNEIRNEFYKDDATMYQKLKDLSKEVNNSLFRE